jgi:hypothetical protein
MVTGAYRESRACVGCGYCCIKNTCTFGRYRHPEAEGRRCPELFWNGKRYVCRMMDLPRMGDFYRDQLQVGDGCASYLNPWREEVRERREDEIPPE